MKVAQFKALALTASYIAYFLIGIFQIGATVDGVKELTGIASFFCWILAFIFGGIPVIGTGLGIYGAHKGWGWDWLPSISLFLGVPLFFMGLVLVAQATDRFMNRRRL